MKSKWRVKEVSVAGTTFYKVYRLLDVAAKETAKNILSHGGLWTTRREAEDLADRLNKREGWA